MSEATENRIRGLVESVEADPSVFGSLSTGEQIAVALVLDRPDLLKSRKWTILEAVERLGNEWLKAALAVQRDR